MTKYQGEFDPETNEYPETGGQATVDVLLDCFLSGVEESSVLDNADLKVFDREDGDDVGSRAIEVSVDGTRFYVIATPIFTVPRS